MITAVLSSTCVGVTTACKSEGWDIHAVSCKGKRTMLVKSRKYLCRTMILFGLEACSLCRWMMSIGYSSCMAIDRIAHHADQTCLFLFKVGEMNAALREIWRLFAALPSG